MYFSIVHITIGFVTEGRTDKRFLEGIIKRTFEEIAFECHTVIEVFDPQPFEISKDKFVNEVEKAAELAFEQGVMVLCIHTDADAETDDYMFSQKILPAFQRVEKLSSVEVCKNLVAIVPVQMTEAWMLADRELLKTEISTHKSDTELGLSRRPETVSNPKELIEDAIRRAVQDLPARRRHHLNIAQLYLPLGKKSCLDQLSKLLSYQKFKQGVREAFKKLHYL